MRGGGLNISCYFHYVHLFYCLLNGLGIGAHYTNKAVGRRALIGVLM